MASDHGVPTNFSTSLALTILVTDVNDHPPVFDRLLLPEPYVVEFWENNTQQNCHNVNVAVDGDSDQQFTVICYHLVGASVQRCLHRCYAEAVSLFVMTLMLFVSL